MNEMDYWRLCDELTVIQAALLIVGADASDMNYCDYVLDWKPDERPPNFFPAFTALCHAVMGGKIPATKRMMIETKWDPTANAMREHETEKLDWCATTISVEDLKIWLKTRGIKTGFFFPQGVDIPDFLDANHKNYSPKLAAAIGAWQAVTLQPDLTKGKTVKQALLTWLRKNADRFGLTKDDGNPNEQGIEEVAKIANWDSRGGAPRTPG
ncbi:hypothetical protein [Desulfofustis limnaeus]|uniref:Uncharacterized protein n=1 Tax=Desulfofustis limnaeus TaxID=2740163 RepID=A0ABN6M2R2_9BACT|nr:hypothetical protein [Desulfofustis limnaeus]BDD86076.1 hypothetical protein DPPLL_04410 [Desulfofustis limnaeus]